MFKKLRFKLVAMALLLAGVSTGAARADSVTFSLATPTVYASSINGGSVTLRATVSAPGSNAGPVFLNGDSYNITAPVSLNDLGFFVNFPLSLAPGGTFTGDLFTLTLPAGSPAGTFLGSFTLLGGPNGASSNTLGTVNFSLVASTPEPSSIVFALTGMAAMVALYFRAKPKEHLHGWAR